LRQDGADTQERFTRMSQSRPDRRGDSEPGRCRTYAR